MRRLLLLLPALLLVTLVLAPSASSAPVYLVKGRGWGHGVGMPQWGAYGFALNGRTYKQILAHYYRGTTIGTAPVSSVRVLLASGRTAVTIRSDAAFKVGSRDLAAGAYRITRTDDGRIRVEGVTQTFASPARFTATSAHLELDGAPYRGALEVRAVSALSVVNEVGLDGYIMGVVPREVPSTWHPEVLKAQALAARSYALASGGGCGGLLCPDTRDQVYGGVSAEQPSTNAAVSATAGEVVMHEGRVAQTFFHSSSGGRTAASAEVWGGNVTYLQSVDDPYDTISPHHTWQLRPLSARQLGDRLRTGTPRSISVSRTASNRVNSITVTTRTGAKVTLSGDTVRARLALRSTWFSINRLAITPSPSPSACGRLVTLSVTATGLRRVALERRPVTGGAWTRLSLVRTDEGLRARHRPCVSTRYRLVTSTFTGAGATLPVSPRVNFTLRQPAGGLRGVVKPAIAGMPVRIQRQQGGAWVNVASTTVRADGVFVARFDVVAGVYRARVTPPAGRGLVPGVSPSLTVSTG